MLGNLSKRVMYDQDCQEEILHLKICHYNIITRSYELKIQIDLNFLKVIFYFLKLPLFTLFKHKE